MTSHVSSSSSPPRHPSGPSRTVPSPCRFPNKGHTAASARQLSRPSTRCTASAYNTAGLRANFAVSDLLVETDDPRKKLLIQVKTGFPTKRDSVYLTQASGEEDLTKPKFVSDFV